MLMLAVASLAFMACQKESAKETIPEGVAREVTFISSNEALTKTYLDDATGGGHVFRWTTTDLVAVYDGVSTQTHIANTAEHDGDQAIFTATVASSTVTVVYPSSVGEAGNITAHGTFSYSVPQSQTAVEGGIGALYCPLVARTNNATGTTPLAFCNVASLVKFRVAHDDITQVALATNVLEKGGVAFSGNFSATLADGSLSVTGYSGQYVDVFPPTGEDVFKQDVDYYISVLPANFVNGFAVVLHHNGGSNVTLNATRALNVERGKVYNIGTLSDSVVSSEFGFKAADLSRDILATTTGQLAAYNLVNPSNKAFTVKLEYYVDDVLTDETTYGGPSGDPAVALSNGVNLFFEGQSCAANQLWLRGIPENATSKTRKYVIYAKTSEDEVTATVTQAPSTAEFAFNHVYHAGDREAAVIDNGGETLWFKIQSLTDKAWSWKVLKDDVQQGDAHVIAADTKSGLISTESYGFASNNTGATVVWKVVISQEGESDITKELIQYPTNPSNASGWGIQGALAGTDWGCVLYMVQNGKDGSGNDQYEIKIDYVDGQKLKVAENNGSTITLYGFGDYDAYPKPDATGTYSDNANAFTLVGGTGTYMLYLVPADSRKLYYVKQ